MQEVITLDQNHPPQYIEKPLLSHFLAAQHLSCDVCVILVHICLSLCQYYPIWYTTPL